MAKVDITQIAVQAQSLIVTARIVRPVSAMRSAVAGEAISQRQALAMRPKLALVNLCRDEVGTCHSACSLPRFYSDRNLCERIAIVRLASSF